MGYGDDDFKWSNDIQEKLAIPIIYSLFWSGCEIIHLDDELKNSLKTILDVSGADKLLKWPNGTCSFLAQRFRRPCKYDDFTLRYSRNTGYKAECFKAIEALEYHKLLAAYYAYGHVNIEEDDFIRFRIIDFVKFLTYWKNDLLTKPRFITNKDGGSCFLAWPFKELPRELILFDYKSGDKIVSEISPSRPPPDAPPIRLTDFLRGSNNE